MTLLAPSARAPAVPRARWLRRATSWPAPIAGLGAGGHAKCAVEAIRSVLRHRVVALVDTDPAFAGVGGTGAPGPRGAAARVLEEAGFSLPPIVHRAAHVARSARLAAGAHVLAGAIVGADARVGRHAIVSAGAIPGHDVAVDAPAHVASGARVGGVPARPLPARSGG